MPSKNSILKGIVNGQVTELYPKTAANNVFLQSGTDVETAMTTMPTTETVEGLISAAIDALIDGAPATYDTLKEISEWIATHQSEYAALIAAIAGKVDKVEGKGLSTEDYTTAEKTKLAGIEANANNYTLPAATTSALGGVKVGSNLAVDANGILSGNYSNASSSAAGLMSAADKTALDAKPDVYVQSTQPSGLKAGDIWFQISE